MCWVHLRRYMYKKPRPGTLSGSYSLQREGFRSVTEDFKMIPVYMNCQEHRWTQPVVWMETVDHHIQKQDAREENRLEWYKTLANLCIFKYSCQCTTLNIYCFEWKINTALRSFSTSQEHLRLPLVLKYGRVIHILNIALRRFEIETAPYRYRYICCVFYYCEYARMFRRHFKKNSKEAFSHLETIYCLTKWSILFIIL